MNELLRDFQLHSNSASNLTSSSHARLLEADDEDSYGQLYVGTDDSCVEDAVDKHLFEFGASFERDEEEVPGPAPEVEPPRPAPSGIKSSQHSDLYSGKTSSSTRSRNGCYENSDGPKTASSARLRNGYENPDYHSMMRHYEQQPQQQPQNEQLPYVNRDLNDNYNGDNQRLQQQQQQQNAQEFHHHQQQQLPQDHQMEKQDYWNNSSKWSSNGLIPNNTNTSTHNGHVITSSSHYSSLTASTMMNNFSNQHQYLTEHTSFHHVSQPPRAFVVVLIQMMM